MFSLKIATEKELRDDCATMLAKVTRIPPLLQKLKYLY